jgi:hypothetical protein
LSLVIDAILRGLAGLEYMGDECCDSPEATPSKGDKEGYEGDQKAPITLR